MNGGWRRRTFNETTYSTMLFSPSCSSLIPEGKYFFDDDAVGVDRGVEVFSLRGALLLARCFRDDHGHFIMICVLDQARSIQVHTGRMKISR